MAMDRNRAIEFVKSFATAKGVAIGIAVIGLVILYLGVSYSDGGKNVVLFIVTSAIGMYAFSLAARIYTYSATSNNTIPDNDRPLLEDLIKNRNNEELEMYIKLASLYGVTGNITVIWTTFTYCSSNYIIYSTCICAMV
jgi:hypothetical protein